MCPDSKPASPAPSSRTKLRGRRTAANLVNLRASKELAGGNKFLDIDVGYSQYQDMCYNDALEPTLYPRTCDGTARGFTYRLGALLTWQRDLHWLFIGDYHLNLNKAQARRLEYLRDTDDDGVGDTIVCAGNICSYPYMAGHSFFLRAQYRY